MVHGGTFLGTLGVCLPDATVEGPMPLTALFSAAIVAVTLSWPSLVEAQRNCSKGKPCGNSCISRDKVCRIGVEASEPAAASVAAPSSSTPAVQNVVSPDQASDPPPAATASEYPWVGSFADGVYFRATCPTAQDLAPANRRYFRTIQDAEGAGFRRSRTSGC